MRVGSAAKKHRKEVLTNETIYDPKGGALQQRLPTGVLGKTLNCPEFLFHTGCIMPFLRSLKRPFSKTPHTPRILPIHQQTKAWRKANRKMGWNIPAAAFEKIGPGPLLTETDIAQGFMGAVLFYGFGEDGFGNADPILSAKEAWEYARIYKKKNLWQCEYIDFERVEDIRQRPGAPSRPKGFYLAKIQLGEKHLHLSVSQVRRGLSQGETGLGPEGVQLLAITHRHFQRLMNEKQMPFLALADYDVAPYGYEDFFDAPQVFHSIGVLGLGIGHVDRNYPLFGIPTLRFINL